MKQLNPFKDYPLFILSLLMALALTIPLRTAFAQTTEANTLTIERVWTRDGNGNDAATFLPKDAIQYVTLIRNTYNYPVKMRIKFEAHGPTWVGDIQNPADRVIYSFEVQDVDVPVGLTGYYSPWTIPAFSQPGSYNVAIIISWPEDGKSWTGYPFSIPGTLATDITTFLSDGVTPTSASEDVTNEVGPGGALVYKITVTNTSHPSTGHPSVYNTGVVLTDPLPPEIFNLISDGTAEIFTDHGTCYKTGSWPSTTVTCPLGNLASTETATIYFTASIIVRNPSGEPSLPGKIVNKVYVYSNQQPSSSEASSSVKTVVEEISDEEINKFVETIGHCVALVPIIGKYAGFVWQLRKGKLGEKLNKVVEFGSKEMFITVLNEIGHRVGLGKKVAATGLNAAECTIEAAKLFLAPR